MTGRLERHQFVCATLALVLATAVIRVHAGAEEDAARPAPRPLGRDLPAQRGEPQPTTPAGQEQNHLDPDGVLILQQALESAVRFNPELAAAEQGVRAAEGGARQAGVWPNPEIELEAEEFGGTDSRKGYDAAQTTARVSQQLELGGKRFKRQAVARSEARLAGWDYEAARLDVLTRTKRAFVDVLAAQGQLTLAEAALTLAGDARKAAAERVKAGKVPQLEEIKAAVEVASSRIARDRAERDLEVARKLLAANWGSATPRFTEAVGSLDVVNGLDPLDALAEALDQSPEIARWTDELAAARESLALARSQRVPDVAVSAGIRRFEDDGALAAVASITLPLPLFDRNTGGIAAAQHNALGAEQKQSVARLRAATELAEVHNRLQNASAEAAAIRETLLPAAQKAFDAADMGYRQGKFGFLEALDAQRTLIEARSRQLAALAAYHKAAADLERLTGISLNTIR